MMQLLRKLLDWPPIWLLGFLWLTYEMRGEVGYVRFTSAVAIGGAVIAGAGLILMLLAVREMFLARTTVIPRQNPDALVTTGVFRLTRNPIYLGDALVLCGAALWWKAPLALVLVPVFGIVISYRFIQPEEAVLRDRFGAEYERWAARVNRWF